MIGGKKILEYLITAKDTTAGVLGGALRGIAGFAKGVFTNLINIKVAFEAIGAGARRMWSAVQEAFKVESMTVRFSVLLGSMEKARDRMKELQDFAAATPFEMEGIANASRQLHVFSDGALGGADSLRVIGDAAAAVGQPIEDLSFWVGRAYSAIKGGQPFGEAAMRLQEMGVMTPQVRQRMEELQNTGAGASEVFGVLEGRLREFGGGMETLSKTGDGLIATLKDDWTLAVADFGMAFMQLAKDEIGYLIARIDQLRADGTIEKWAESAKKAVQPLVEMIGNLFDSQSRGESLSAAWDYLKSVLEYGKDLMFIGADYLYSKITEALSLERIGGAIKGAIQKAASVTPFGPAVGGLLQGAAALGADEKPVGEREAALAAANAKFDRDREAAAERIAAAAAERRARAAGLEGGKDFVGPPRPAGEDDGGSMAGTLSNAPMGPGTADKEARAAQQERLQEIERNKAWLEQEAQRQMNIATQEGNRKFRQKDVADRLAAKDAAEADEKDVRKTARQLAQAQAAKARGVTLSEKRQALVDMENERLAKKENAEKAAAEARNKAEELHNEKVDLQTAINSLPEIARDVSGMRASLDRNLQFG